MKRELRSTTRERQACSLGLQTVCTRRLEWLRLDFLFYERKGDVTSGKGLSYDAVTNLKHIIAGQRVQTVQNGPFLHWSHSFTRSHAADLDQIVLHRCAYYRYAGLFGQTEVTQKPQTMPLLRDLAASVGFAPAHSFSSSGETLEISSSALPSTQHTVVTQSLGRSRTAVDAGQRKISQFLQLSKNTISAWEEWMSLMH